MTKKERLMAVLNHQMPDHIPVGFWFHFDGDEGAGDKCVEAHLKYYRETDIDFVKIMSDSLGYPLRVVISKAEDWFNVKPLPEDDPFFTDTVKRCRAITDAIGDECYTYYNFFSAVNIVRERDVFTQELAQGRSNYEIVAAHIRENPDAVRYAMCVIAGDYVRLAEKVVHDGGCLGIYQSLQGAEIDWLTKEEYETVAKPADLLQLEGINKISPYNMIHMCSWAGTPNHLEYWKDYPGAIKNWGTGVEGVSLTEGRKLFGEGCVILGGLDNRLGHPLVSGAKEEIQQTVRDLLEEMKGIPFIIGADCTVPNTIDMNHICWVVETARENPAL